MAGYVCAQFTSGPNCSDNRIEKTDAEKTDCLKKAFMECVSDAWRCRADILADLPSRVGFNRDGNNFSDSTLRPLDDIRCYTENNDCLERIRQCYCASGMTGLTCTACPDDLGGRSPRPEEVVPTPEEDTPDEEVDPAREPYYVPVTVSSDGDVIPIVFGRAILGGNIVWVDTQSNQGSVALVDFALGVCAGSVESIRRVWMADTLVVDRTSEGITADPSSGLSVKLFSGTEYQKVNPGMVSTFGRTPAYRGLCYIVIRGYPVTGTNPSLPQFRVEVTTATGSSVEWNDTGANTDTPLVVNPATLRGYTSTPTTIDARDADGALLYSLSVTDAPNILSVSSREDVAFQGSSGEITCVVGGFPERRLTSAPVSALEFISCGRDSTSVGDPCVVAGLSGGSLIVARGTDSLTVTEFTMGGTPLFVAVVDDSTVISAFLSSDTVSIHALDLSTDTSSTASLALSTLGLPSGATVTAASLHDGYLIFVASSGTRSLLISVDPFAPEIPRWFTQTTVVPDGAINATAGDTLAFLHGDSLYSLDASTGVVSQRSARLSSLPAVNSAVFYDGITDTLTFSSSDGSVIRVVPDRVVTAPVTGEAVVSRLLELAGASASQYDVSALAAVTIDGFVIFRDDTLSRVLEELSSFYHWGVSESSAGIRVTPLGTTSVIVVDDLDVVSHERTRAVDIDTSTTYVRMGYYDEASEFSTAYQEVTRDMLRGEDFGIGAGIFVDTSVFTDATTARVSAELAMLRILRRTRRHTLHLSPRHLALEALDIVTINGVSVRLDSVTLSPAFSGMVSGYEDDIAIYEESPALTGSSISQLESQISGQAGVGNVLVAFNLPFPDGSTRRERVLLGQVNPSTTTLGETFVPDTWSVDTIEQDAPTTEVLTGVLVSGLTTPRTDVFTTDYVNTVTIRFSKSIPAGHLRNADKLAIIEDPALNLLFVGSELIQFMNHVIDVDGRTVTFDGLLRGRFGSDIHVDTHVIGEACAYYTEDSVASIAVSADTVTRGYAEVSMFSADYPDNAIDARVHFESVLEEWLNLTVLVYPTPTGTSTAKVAFQVIPRIAQKSFFTDNSQINSYANGEDVRAFVLSGPFDKASFESAYLDGEGAWGASSYIRFAGTESPYQSEMSMSLFITEGLINTSAPATMKFIADTHVALVKGGRYTEAISALVPTGARYHVPSGSSYQFLSGRTLRG